mmetsp:Transcript_82620/g.164066  ORF Transcript_82620/g.164066 Transcript_82620/m.164066 type:complete len:221 (+) Transcript_82620:695-1357(+)
MSLLISSCNASPASMRTSAVTSASAPLNGVSASSPSACWQSAPLVRRSRSTSAMRVSLLVSICSHCTCFSVRLLRRASAASTWNCKSPAVANSCFLSATAVAPSSARFSTRRTKLSLCWNMTSRINSSSLRRSTSPVLRRPASDCSCAILVCSWLFRSSSASTRRVAICDDSRRTSSSWRAFGRSALLDSDSARATRNCRASRSIERKASRCWRVFASHA